MNLIEGNLALQHGETASRNIIYLENPPSRVIPLDIERPSIRTEGPIDIMADVRELARGNVEGVRHQFRTEAGEAVLKTMMEFSVEYSLTHDQNGNKDLIQGGFSMNELMVKGIKYLEDKFGNDSLERFEWRRRVQEGINYQYLLKNIERLSKDEVFLELSPYPEGIIEAYGVGARERVENFGYGDNLGVLRIYRRNTKGAIEISQLKVQNNFERYDRLIEELKPDRDGIDIVTQGFLSDQNIQFEEESIIDREGTDYLSKSGFIRSKDIYDIVLSYLQSNADLRGIYKSSTNTANNILQKYTEEYIKFLAENIDTVTPDELIYKKITLWRNIAHDFRNGESYKMLLEVDGEKVIVTSAELDKVIKFCGGKLTIGASDRAVRTLGLMGIVYAEDEVGSKGFECPDCGWLNMRSILFSGKLNSKCICCGSKKVGCED